MNGVASQANATAGVIALTISLSALGVHRLKRVIAPRGLPHAVGVMTAHRRCAGMAAMAATAAHRATYRYAAVGAITTVLVFFLLLAPGADWSRAVALSLEGLALVIALATSRERADVRRARSR